MRGKEELKLLKVPQNYVHRNIFYAVSLKIDGNFVLSSVSKTKNAIKLLNL
jgi:hypothetical protein